MPTVTKNADLSMVMNQTEEAYRKGNWRDLPIEECGEPLVEVPAEFCHSFYALEMNLTGDKRVFLRQAVFQMFLLAVESFRRVGMGLLIYDGWRSIELQENLFWYYLKLFTASKFGLQAHFAPSNTSPEIKLLFRELPDEMQEKVKEANRTYVSWPSSDPTRPSPHSTGGSIDVWPTKEGQPVDLGVPFDWMEDEAGAFYHLKPKRVQFQNDKGVCRNRELLLHSMVGAGFSCYPAEFWHFNAGNQMDSLVTGEVARYSYIEP